MTLAEITAFIVAGIAGIVRLLTSVDIGGIALVYWVASFWIIATIISMIFATDVPGTVSEGSSFGSRRRSRK